MAHIFGNRRRQETPLIAHTSIGPIFVTTVVVDSHYETFIFGDTSLHVLEEHYFTREDAREGHRRIVGMLREVSDDGASQSTYTLAA